MTNLQLWGFAVSKNMIPLFKVGMNRKLDPAVSKILHSGFVGQGDAVEEFEKALSEYIENPNVLTVAAGTHAIHLALVLAGVGPGDEVITSPLSCSATNWPILYQGAKPIWCDIDPETGNIDPNEIENLITDKTKAIMVVHWGGYPCDMDRIEKIADYPHIGSTLIQIPIIEDAAHAFGAKYRERMIGSVSDFTCFNGNTRIITKKGKEKIKDVKIGDMVLTSDGTYQKVLNVFQRKYSGKWARFYGGQVGFISTKDHPVYIDRDEKNLWLAAEKVRVGDYFYVSTKKCIKCSINLVPYYGKVCPECYLQIQNSNRKRKKLSIIKNKNKRYTSRLLHHKKYVEPIMKRYKQDGYRVIPLARVIPDFLAMKDNKIIAIEVESGTTIKYGKKDKYDLLEPHSYDDVVWITKKAKFKASRYSYTIVGNLAKVKVIKINHSISKNNQGKSNTKIVYNLTVDGNHTYFAHNTLVHNCFSFQAIKHLTSVDGGALAVTNEDNYERGKLIRWYGIDREDGRKEFRCENDIKEFGYKYHMNNVAATIGLANLKRIDAVLKRHRQNARYYNHELSNIPGITLLRNDPDIVSSYWIYTMKVEKQSDFERMMTEKGVMVNRVHERNDKHSCVAEFKRDLPQLDQFVKEMICIPCGWWVSREDREYIVDSIRGGW